MLLAKIFNSFSMMLPGMFGSCHDAKIRNSIIILYPIFMVNNFSFEKFSSKMFLHFKSMLKHILFVANFDKNITRSYLRLPIIPSRVIFAKFSNCKICTSTCTVLPLFCRKDASGSTIKAILFIINSPNTILLFLGFVLTCPFKFFSWLMPYTVTSMSPRFGDFFYKHNVTV